MPDHFDQTPDPALQTPKFQTVVLGPLSRPHQTPDDFYQTPDWTIRRLIPWIRRLGFKIQIWVFDRFLQLDHQMPNGFYQAPNGSDQTPDPLDQTPDPLRKGASRRLAPFRADCTLFLFLTVDWPNGVQIQKIRIHWKANWMNFLNLPIPSHLSHPFMVLIELI